uniref:EGF-like domain-containing protein n=1 Tax=Steinernema glaseri TaxID=37863 RepID=A0A1I7ZN86_9BILA
MRTIGAWVSVGLLCCFGHLTTAEEFLFANGTVDICKAKEGLCGQNGRCVSAPLEWAKFFCKCDECFGGAQCEVNICETHRRRVPLVPLEPYQTFLRVLIVFLGFSFGIAAVCTLLFQRLNWGRRKDRVRGIVSAESSEISRVSTYLGHPGQKASFCERMFSSVINKKPKPTVTPAPSLSSVHVISMDLPTKTLAIGSSTMKKPRRPIAWDEVEMRRHGLVDRRCKRPDEVEATDPKSVDVSVFEPRLTGHSTFSSASSVAGRNFSGTKGPGDASTVRT